MNIGGMCCTITTGTGRVAGSDGISSARAVGPPVDTPIAIRSTRCAGPVARATVPVAREGRCGMRAGARSFASRAAGSSAAIRGSSSARIFSIEDAASPPEGFNT